MALLAWSVVFGFPQCSAHTTVTEIDLILQVKKVGLGDKGQFLTVFEDSVPPLYSVVTYIRNLITTFSMVGICRQYPKLDCKIYGCL